jgi:hypothetical protein
MRATGWLLGFCQPRASTRVGIVAILRSFCCIHPTLAGLPRIYFPIPPIYPGVADCEKHIHAKTDFEYNDKSRWLQV